MLLLLTYKETRQRTPLLFERFLKKASVQYGLELHKIMYCNGLLYNSFLLCKYLFFISLVHDDSDPVFTQGILNCACFDF